MFKDLTNMKFGMWTVLELNVEESTKKRGKTNYTKRYWNCKCVCGKIKPVVECNLIKGKTTNCGCYKAELITKRNIEKWKNDEYRQKMLDSVKKQWNNENFRKKQSEQMRQQMIELWKTEDYKKHHALVMKSLWENEDFKKKQSEKAKKQWENEDFRKKVIDVHHTMCGEKGTGWKGGISNISSHLRGLCEVENWLKTTKEDANYTCQLTGKQGKLHTHHLYSFGSIVIDAHVVNNIDIKKQIKDYTSEELKLIEDYVKLWHKDNTNAIVLNDEIHKLFHNEYGLGNNTPEQFEEFKKRYIVGEFDDILIK